MFRVLLLLAAMDWSSLHVLSPRVAEVMSKPLYFSEVINSLITAEKPASPHTIAPLDTADVFRREGVALPVIDKVMATLECAQGYQVDHTDIITVVDFSLPSSEKRLWVVDLQAKKLLFNTYVSHGIRSGELTSDYFSNKNNSKASSIGVFKTDKPYHGRHGLSLQLEGLDSGFNDNAASRSIVMHGGWYVEERFIKRFGRAGRSWGCPAVPDELIAPIVNTIKEKSLFVAYYPNDRWLERSKFLNCHQRARNPKVKPTDEIKPPVENEPRDEILFVDLKNDNKRTESDPIVVMSANNYEKLFHAPVPVDRMLRRQINNLEYIAVSKAEFKQLVDQANAAMHAGENSGFDAIRFVIPVIKMHGGYYATEMHIVPLGTIQQVQLTMNQENQLKGYAVRLSNKPLVNLKGTSQFIRWVGL